MALGCPTVSVNTGQACPNGERISGTLRDALALRRDPTGLRRRTRRREGLNRRILCNTAIDGANAVNNCDPNGGANVCTHPNRWPRGGPAPADLEGDPRVVDVFVTPFGTFTGTGVETVPVINAGRFYITGYTGSGRRRQHAVRGQLRRRRQRRRLLDIPR